MRTLIAIALALAIILASVACSRPGPTSGPPSPTETPAPPAGEQQAATPGDTDSFAGAWITSWGLMVLTVSGTDVRGEYHYYEEDAHQRGRIQATLSADGRKLEGTWAEAPGYAPPDEAGRLALTLAQDGGTLAGYWWYGEDHDGGEWVGTRLPWTVGDEPDDSFAGAWITNWGGMFLTVSGAKVRGEYHYYEEDGSYRQGRIEAALSAGGRSLEGTWAQAPGYEPPDEAGRLVLALSPGGRSLEGDWWYGEDQHGGRWIGTRAGRPGSDELQPAGTATPGQAGLTLSSNPDNDLLFYITREDGSRLYYHGLGSGGAMRLTHLTLQDPTGSLEVIIFNRGLLPIQWILEETSIAVYPEAQLDDEADYDEEADEDDEAGQDDQADYDDETGYDDEEAEDDPWAAFNPHRAVHVAFEGGEETAVVADIYPADLQAVVEGMEAALGVSLDDARAFLAEYDVTFEELIELAGQEGPEQARFIAAAAGFSAAAAALGLAEAEGGLSAAARTPGLAAPLQSIWRPVVKVAAGALGGVLRRHLGGLLDPGDGPAVGVLLCAGAAKYGVCHYMFYHRSRLGECIENCHTSLSCFTDICMPMDISVDLALNTAR